MIKRFLILSVAFLFITVSTFAQVGDNLQGIVDLKEQKKAKQAQIDALNAEITEIDTKILEFPGWSFGGVGTVGFNITSNNNWYALSTPNSSSNGLGLGFIGYGNYNADKYFWRNTLNINLNRLATLSDKDDESTRSIALTDLLDLTSLGGYKLNPKLALSAEVKWISSLIDIDFKDLNSVIDDEYSLALNSPGQMTFSAGITWLPITDLVVIFHPLGYQKNWPGEFASSPGCKIGATYTKELYRGIKWNSSLNAFIPYASDKNVDHKDASDALLRTVNYDTGGLMNWLWNNSFSFTVWKGIGVGLNVGLRGDKQIADLGRLKGESLVYGNTLIVDPVTMESRLPNTDEIQANALTQDIDDSPVQLFWNLGLSYGF